MCPNWFFHSTLYIMISSFMNHVIIHLIKPNKMRKPSSSSSTLSKWFLNPIIFLLNLWQSLFLHSYLPCLVSGPSCSPARLQLWLLKMYFVHRILCLLLEFSSYNKNGILKIQKSLCHLLDGKTLAPLL